MNKKWYTKFLVLILTAALLLSGCNQKEVDSITPSVSAASEMEETEPSADSSDVIESSAVRLQDDFYAAINEEWLASAEIPATDVTVGGMMDLVDGIEELLMADFESMLNSNTNSVNAEIGEFLKYYAMAADYDTRNAQGADPLLPYLEQIGALDGLNDLDAVLADWMRQGMAAPFSLIVMADMGNASANALYAAAPTLYLPDVSYYENETGTLLLEYFSQTVQQLLVLTGYTEDEAVLITSQALAFDALLVPLAKTAEEASEYTKMYNPAATTEFAAYSSKLDLEGLVTSLVGITPDQVIVTDPRFFTAMDEILTDENFELLKSWLIVETVYSAARYLSDDFRETAASYSMIIYGQTEMEDPQVMAYYLASNIFSEVIGCYYGETYFGTEAKADVVSMVTSMIDIYKKSLAENDWLSKETIQAAITKLENISIQVGYPDALDPLYSRIVVDEDKTLWENNMKFMQLIMEDNYAKFKAEVNRSQWTLSADTVNAMYSPLTNTIMFPAAILQAPFYSLEQTDSQNYGGIGAVIAHEISHAFDNNGAQFDELGNLENWWTEEDYAAFEQLTKDMVTLFDGIEFAGRAVNGTLTVAENIADAGGLSCALEATRMLPDANPEEFFINWAVIWRMKATEQYEQLLLMADVHAPNKLRVNVQLQNLDDFYTAFDINDGDGMYLPVEKRVKIW